uniref:Reverse transcriptase Ty1/copia-type domain-containing protein n=1 Tax=Solanum lycopersicum TaxID=4081 RepID=A0A3Q7EB73_SOLLC
MITHFSTESLTGTNTTEITELMACLDSTFKIKDLGRLHYFLGLEILDIPGGVLVSQRKKRQRRNSTASSHILQKISGKLNFLTNTRLDILQAAFHLLRYLKQDPTLGLHLTKDPDCSIKAYCDSDWASCPDSRRSVSGYLVLLENSPISWKSNKQETISLSSVEAEYRSIRKVI